MPKVVTTANLSPQTYNILDDTARFLRQEIRKGHLPSRGRGKSWGVGTVAASLVEYVVREHPELLEQIGHASERKTDND